MACSLYRSRADYYYLPVPKFYGYKTINAEEEKKLIERLSKPTISFIQNQLSNLSNRSDYHNVNTNDKKNRINLIEESNHYDLTLTNRITSSSSPSSLSTSNSSSRLIDLRSIDDYENVSDRLKHFTELWNRTEPINPLLPLCACPRGEILLKEDNVNWIRHNTQCHCSSATTSPHHRSTTLREPVEWNRINQIVRRLHSANTAGSLARHAESQALLATLSERHNIN
ncbi:unnamed protein product, partial [Schistosoma turkestanicum]